MKNYIPFRTRGGLTAFGELKPTRKGHYEHGTNATREVSHGRHDQRIETSRWRNVVQLLHGDTLIFEFEIGKDAFALAEMNHKLGRVNRTLASQFYAMQPKIGIPKPKLSHLLDVMTHHIVLTPGVFPPNLIGSIASRDALRKERIEVPFIAEPRLATGGILAMKSDFDFEFFKDVSAEDLHLQEFPANWVGHEKEKPKESAKTATQVNAEQEKAHMARIGGQLGAVASAAELERRCGNIVEMLSHHGVEARCGKPEENGAIEMIPVGCCNVLMLERQDFSEKNDAEIAAEVISMVKNPRMVLPQESKPCDLPRIDRARAELEEQGRVVRFRKCLASFETETTTAGKRAGEALGKLFITSSRGAGKTTALAERCIGEITARFCGNSNVFVEWHPLRGMARIRVNGRMALIVSTQKLAEFGKADQIITFVNTALELDG